MAIGRRWMLNKLILNIQQRATLLTSSNLMASSDGFKDVFSSQNKQRTIDVLSQLDPNLLGYEAQPGDKLAAILVPLCYDTLQRPSLLYNLRSENLTLNKGEISFPGGGLEERDNGDVIKAALRETEEELGIDPKMVQVWTTLPSLPSIRASLKVIPVLGFIQEPVDPTLLKINPDEVQYGFTVPLSHLCDSKNWSMTHGTKDGHSYSIPAYHNIQEFVKNDKLTIWGLTSIVTHMSLSGLLPDLYERDIQVDRSSLPKPRL